MSFDDFVDKKIFAKLEARPVLTLLVIAMLYVLAFTAGMIPR
jgi:hypothetical protein